MYTIVYIRSRITLLVKGEGLTGLYCGGEAGKAATTATSRARSRVVVVVEVVICRVEGVR